MKLPVVGLVLAASLAALAVAGPASPRLEIVACSPGSPGTTADAQPAMDAFTAAVSAKASVALAAVYEPDEAQAVKRLEHADLALVSLPFYLAHRKALGLQARLEVVRHGAPALESWALVAKKGRVTGAASLAGFTIAGNVAYAPAFVRGPVLAGLGALPSDVKLKYSAAVLSMLHRAAEGRPVAVVLDAAQQAGLASLPFASQLEVVARSPAMPGVVLATVGTHVSDHQWRAIEAALRGLPSTRDGAAALAGMQLDGFAPLDVKALAAAQAAFDAASP